MKQMKNPNETNGYVMLYTMQDKRSLDVLKKERRIQRINKAIDPIGDSKADWQILMEAASIFISEIRLSLISISG